MKSALNGDVKQPDRQPYKQQRGRDENRIAAQSKDRQAEHQVRNIAEPQELRRLPGGRVLPHLEREKENGQKAREAPQIAHALVAGQKLLCFAFSLRRITRLLHIKEARIADVLLYCDSGKKAEYEREPKKAFFT